MSGNMQESYNLKHRFGWSKVYRELKHISSLIWNDTIIYPHTLAICNRKGHDWETEYTLPQCNHCYQMREDIDPVFAEEIRGRRIEESAKWEA